MTQKAKLLKIVKRNPGLTATMYTRLMGFSQNGQLLYDTEGNLTCNTYYKPATILRELHRFVETGELRRIKAHGMLRGKAWRFINADMS